MNDARLTGQTTRTETWEGTTGPLIGKGVQRSGLQVEKVTGAPPRGSEGEAPMVQVVLVFKSPVAKLPHRTQATQHQIVRDGMP